MQVLKCSNHHETDSKNVDLCMEFEELRISVAGELMQTSI